jgi:hypothetical protein
MPWVVAVGGRQRIGGFGPFGRATTTPAPTPLATAVSLDLATLAWGGGGTVPDLPTPREEISLGQLPGGAAGGGRRLQH